MNTKYRVCFGAGQLFPEWVKSLMLAALPLGAGGWAVRGVLREMHQQSTCLECVYVRAGVGAGDTTRTQSGMNPSKGNARAGSALLQPSSPCGFKQGAGCKGLPECQNAPSPKISCHWAGQSLSCLGREGRCAPDRCIFNTEGFGREEGSAFLPKHFPAGNGKAECAQFRQGSLFSIPLLLFSSAS